MPIVPDMSFQAQRCSPEPGHSSLPVSFVSFNSESFLSLVFCILDTFEDFKASYAVEGPSVWVCLCAVTLLICEVEHGVLDGEMLPNHRPHEKL